MPAYVLKTRVPMSAAAQAVAVAEQANVAIGLLEMVGRGCHLEDYQKQDIPSFQVRGDIIAYASPDSTFAVTKQLLDEAQTSILIGIYDFTATYMEEIFLAAMARGVKVSMMLDIDSKTESDMFDHLCQMVSNSTEFWL
jgi:phosphatidylserine/phosphatidylglycerophosphate/cardiolipin synthase-like enzyme